MNVPSRICIGLFAVVRLVGTDFSYVVLNGRGDRNSLVRVSADGQTVTTIAHGAAGFGLTKDHAGNYVVAAVGSLLSVTPSGAVRTIAKAPAGSQWMSVVQEADGTFAVADNRLHAVWRVSSDGLSVSRLCNYPVKRFSEMEDTSLVLDGQGNILLLEDNDAAQLFRITPDGDASPIPLGRSIRRISNITVDSQGQFVFLRSEEGELLRVTATGQVTSTAGVTTPWANLVGLAEDPQTGEFVMTNIAGHRLIRLGASRTNIILRDDPSYLSYPVAVIAERNR